MFWSNFGDFTLENDPWLASTWRSLRRLQGEMNRMFEDATVMGNQEFPPLNAWANQEQAVVMAELPGVDPQNLDLSVLGQVLTLSGERTAIGVDEQEKVLRRERRTGRFSRSLELPFPVSADAVDAQYKNGILRVTLQRAEEDRPRKILVK